MLRCVLLIAYGYIQTTACYMGALFSSILLHLATTLNKLLVILLLLSLAAQSSVYLYDAGVCISFIQEAEDKNEKKNCEDKNEKEYFYYPVVDKTALLLRRSFFSHSFKPGVSPLLDRPTPPPDVRYCS